jgi:hypothetical protein
MEHKVVLPTFLSFDESSSLKLYINCVDSKIKINTNYAK